MSLTIHSKYKYFASTVRRAEDRGFLPFAVCRLFDSGKRELKKFLFVIRDFYETRQELEVSTNIRDFTTIFYVVLRRASSQ